MPTATGASVVWDNGITGPHRDIAGSDHARIGVLAGPGTGKTSFGLMRRVVRLLEEGVPGDRVLLLSFTRVAAADLREKVAALQVDGVEHVRATTLHGYCFGLLRQDAVLTVIGRTPRILLDHEIDLMLRDIGGDFGTIHDRRRLLEAFAAGWARGIDDYPGIAATPEEVAFQGATLTWLREHEAMLIGEVVPLAHQYLAHNPAAEELLAFDHVIVDEYQDLNVLEQRLLDLLAGNGSLCVAGDEDQSIYSVRYANPNGILDFLGRDDVEGYSIGICGRCPANILAIANSLIGQAPGRTKPDLQPREATEDGDVSIVQWPNTDTEVEGIVAAIAADIGSNRRAAGDVLVLTNWRKLGEQIRERLNETGIPTRSFFTEEELGSDAARQALAHLRLVVNETDAPALRVLVGLGDGTGRSAAYQRLLTFCRANACSPLDALRKLADGERLQGVNVPALVTRYVAARAHVDRLRELDVNALVDELLPDGDEATADLRAVAVAALDLANTPGDVLRSIVDAITQDEVPQTPDFVRVMSLHKSKGLTSPAVFVVGAIDGVLPTVRGDDVATINAAAEEGRRLAYVAVTRAANELVISSATSTDLADASARGVRHDRSTIRRVGDRLTVRTIASPYLAELGPDAPAPIRGEQWLRQR